MSSTMSLTIVYSIATSISTLLVI